MRYDAIYSKDELFDLVKVDQEAKGFAITGQTYQTNTQDFSLTVTVELAPGAVILKPGEVIAGGGDSHTMTETTTKKRRNTGPRPLTEAELARREKIRQRMKARKNGQVNEVTETQDQLDDAHALPEPGAGSEADFAKKIQAEIKELKAELEPGVVAATVPPLQV